MTQPKVLAVSLDTGDNNFSKTPAPSITFLKDRGVKDDRHCAKNDSPEFSRQVLLVSSELLETLNQGSPKFALTAGQLGENITTQGIDLEELEKDSKLHFLSSDSVMRLLADVIQHDSDPVLRVTDFRPTDCSKMDKNIGEGLRQRCMDEGKAGRFAVVERGGEIGKDTMIFHEP